MSWETAANTIRSRWASQMSSLQTAYDNAPFERSEDEWARLTVLPGESRQAMFGGVGYRTFRTVGVVVAQLFVRVGRGDGRVNELADLVVAAFRGINASGVRFRTPSISNMGRTKDGWWQVNVSCPFFVDETA